MTVESEKVPVKDGALVISWDEVVERAINMYKFIEEHGTSVKADNIRTLLKERYFYYIFYGLDNTPLFSYDTKVMNPESKTAYLKAASNNAAQGIQKFLYDYMEILKDNDYKLTDSVINFRENLKSQIAGR